MMYGYGRGYAGDYGCFGSGFFHNGWDLLIGVGIIAIIGVVLYLLVNKNKKRASNDSVFELLNMKYAKGEISIEEYSQRRKVLSETK